MTAPPPAPPPRGHLSTTDRPPPPEACVGTSSTPPSPLSFAVGDRLRVGAGTPTHPAPAATVRYVGPVAGTPAGSVWIGLEYDEDGRGRHDGCVKEKKKESDAGIETTDHPGSGVRYFSTRRGAPTSGSLVREAALAGVAVRGIGLLDGLRARYQAGAGVSDGGGDGHHHPSSSHHHHLAGAAAVAARQADLASLTTACLAGSAVAGVGASPSSLPSDDLTATLPALADLDLSASLVGGWGSGAAPLGRALPGLTRLSLAACGLGAGEAAALAAPPPRPLPLTPAFPALRTLVLARTGLGWRTFLERVARDVPALETLSLAHCGLESVAPPPPPGILSHLTQLDVGDNALVGRAALAGLWATAGALPALACLDASGNGRLFSEGGCGGGGGGGAPASLPALATLRLAGCGLSAWSDVVALVGGGDSGGEGGDDSAPSLPSIPLAPAVTSLRLSDNALPPWTPTAGSHRADLVARLPPRIIRLNGAGVSDRERAEAVRALARARTIGGGGGGDASAGPATARPPLAASLASLTLHFPGGAQQQQQHTVRLPASTTVARLRMVVARLGKASGLDAASVTLRAAPLGEGRGSPAAVVLGPGEDGRDLGFLGLGGGGEVWVEK